MSTTHDQSFKSLILDYLLQALQLFAVAEAPSDTEQVEILHHWAERILDAETLDEVFRVH